MVAETSHNLPADDLYHVRKWLHHNTSRRRKHTRSTFRIECCPEGPSPDRGSGGADFGDDDRSSRRNFQFPTWSRPRLLLLIVECECLGLFESVIDQQPRLMQPGQPF